MSKLIDNLADSYNLFMGAVVALLTAIFGTFWYLFAAFLLLNFLDFFTGWTKARQLKKESSSDGLKGFFRKVGSWIMLAVAFIIPSAFSRLGNDILHIDLSFLHLFGWLCLAMLTINEARSILENLVELGCRVPNFLIRGLAITEKLVQAGIKIDDDNDNNDKYFNMK